MHSHPVGLDVWYLVWLFVYLHTSCMRTAKAQARLYGCIGSPEPSLVAYVIISWAGPVTLMMLRAQNPWKYGKSSWLGITWSHIRIPLKASFLSEPKRCFIAQNPSCSPSIVLILQGYWTDIGEYCPELGYQRMRACECAWISQRGTIFPNNQV